jgi:hypothetical protein
MRGSLKDNFLEDKHLIAIRPDMGYLHDQEQQLCGAGATEWI